MLILKFGHGEMVSCKRGAFNDILCLGNLFWIDKKKGTIIIYKNKECFKHVWSSSTNQSLPLMCLQCAQPVLHKHTQKIDINTSNLPFPHNSYKMSGEKCWNRIKTKLHRRSPWLFSRSDLEGSSHDCHKCLLLLLTNYLHISVQT